MVEAGDDSGYVLTAPPAVDVDEDPFEAFFESNYAGLVRFVMSLGASLHQAEDAASEAMCEVYRRWQQVLEPVAYARRAAFTYYLREKRRDGERVSRTIAGGQVTEVATEDNALNVWVDAQWVSQLLAALPPAQREVMAYVVDGFARSDIAELLGKTEDAVRKNLQFARVWLKGELARATSLDEAQHDHSGPEGRANR